MKEPRWSLPSPETVPEPKKFRTLLTLTLVSAALWVLSSLPGLFAFDDIMATVTGWLDDQPDFSAQDLEAFEDQLRSRSRRLDLAEWRRRPWHEQVADGFCRLTSALM